MESELPEEVIVFEILTRVSLGALLHKFQWVCREWHNYIHESKFQLIHSQRTPIVATGLFLVIRRSIENISDSIRFIPFKDDHFTSSRNPSPSLDFLPSPVEIVGSSPYGSLLCCVALDKLQTRKSIPVFYILVTQTYSTLQYKIVRISNTRGIFLEYHCEILDSVTWVWKRSADMRTSGCLVDTYGGVYINGCLHWINNLRQIFVFSIEQEKWNAIIKLPPDIESEFNFLTLLILIDGKIGVLISSFKDHISWKRKFRKDLRALSHEVGDVCVPIAMSSTSIIFMIGRCPNSCRAITYNSNDDTYTISAPFPSDVSTFIGFPFESRFCYL
ncbi:hypothetical protein MKX01_033640 [Papaver californicum]|nr:hypothetical protein MKX01_033640 [Papaver californicum]